METQLADSLKQKGWDIRTALTPSHIGIKGNEMADEMAKLGAKGELDLCQHVCATKAWWYAEARKRYLGKRRMELGIKHEHSTECFATAHRLIAYLRKNQNNVHADRNHWHLFESCSLLDTARSKIFDKTAKDMHEDDFFFNPNNIVRICHFLKRTRLGFSKGINRDDKLSDNCQNVLCS
jgi:hypothetical protein